jgi:hypothetical protein
MGVLAMDRTVPKPVEPNKTLVEQLTEKLMTRDGYTKDTLPQYREKGYLRCKVEATQFISDLRLAQLAEQIRPHTETAIHRFGEGNDGYDEGKEVMYQSMLKAGYRKVKGD